MLIRMTMALCAGIFGAMTIGGEDNGQKRFGLVAQAPTVQTMAAVVQTSNAPEQTVVQATAEKSLILTRTNTEVSLANFAPAEPVMVATAEPEVAIEQPITLGQFVLVGANSANVRQGPGKEHAVVGRVTAGQEVELLSQDGDWSFIKTQDGAIEGYVASRLLQG